MSSELSRRTFIKQAGVSAAAALLPFHSMADLLKKDSPIQLGYSAITWGGNDMQAIKDIASLGFKGVQLRSNVISEYENKPEAIRQLLKESNITAPVFSSGNINVNPAEKDAHLEKHLRHAIFLKAIGGKYLQLTNNARPKDRNPTPDELKNLGQLMNEIGKRAADQGITVVYHNHMHQLGETPEEVDRIMDATDAKHVKMLLDVAHYFQGGGDPAKAIRQYKEVIQVMHIKDVEKPVRGEANGRTYKFVELGRGKVDLPAVFDALQAINFKSWAIVELDSVPDPSRTPLQCAQISKTYLNEKLGFSI